MRLNRITLLFPTLLLLLAGCSRKDKPTYWYADFDQVSKNPYSLYLAYNSLPSLFPGASTERLKSSSRLTNLGYQLRRNKGKSLLMMVGLRLQFATDEVDSLLAFVEAGHQVVLSAARFDDAFLDRLRLEQTSESSLSGKKRQLIYLKDKSNQAQSFAYSYHDRDILSVFSSSDTVTAPFFTLGLNEQKQPDCIMFAIGEGRMILHAAPVAFTNHFLLQGENHRYLDALFSYLPGKYSNVYLCSFNYRDVSYSDWGVLWRNKATRTALLLTFLALFIFVLFEMKRRQQVIPVIPPVENASVAFVETIGRLYFNKKDHTNLAEKMVQHFLDFVRNHYYLNTNLLDQDFIRNLAAKSGKGIAQTDTLVHYIREVQAGAKTDEAFLYTLYNQIQEFYHGK
ncbi:DUF4350 domain-containing protein [Taibaiella koreensis]|uniref:DUF4350 domain-containing protein n=1 Tax=Taibaiella koreensis TaxID=1268548 RepID=UPI000E59FB7B|nr:DUF4350 domain-containing protein [Taibaiella koreensis]